MAIGLGSLVAVAMPAGIRAMPFPPQKGIVTAIANTVDVMWRNGILASGMPDANQLDELTGTGPIQYLASYVQPISPDPDATQYGGGVVTDTYSRNGADRIVVRTRIGYIEVDPAGYSIDGAV